MLQHGSIIYCQWTRHDIERGFQIYGRSKGYWNDGKMHDRKSNQVQLDEIAAPLTKKRQIAIVDIMAIGKRKTLLVAAVKWLTQ